MEEKLKALAENKEFIAKAEKCKDDEAFKALLAEYGVELTEDMIKRLSSEELSDNALADVAGGKMTWTEFWHKWISCYGGTM